MSKGEVTTTIGNVLKPLGVHPKVEDLVYAELREQIVNQSIVAGTRLAQRDVAELLGVSQTPVRAALHRLAVDGFVAPTNGTAVVTPLTREGYQEIMAARLGLEGLAARLGAPQLGDEDLVAMRSILRDLERLGEGANHARTYFGLRWNLHVTCYQAAKRPRLLADVERQFYRSERYATALFADRDMTAKSHARYSEFVNACDARDGRAAEASIIDAIRWGYEDLAPRFPSETTDGH